MQGAALGQPTSASSQPAWGVQALSPSAQPAGLYVPQSHTQAEHHQFSSLQVQQPVLPEGPIMFSQDRQQQVPMQHQTPFQQVPESYHVPTQLLVPAQQGYMQGQGPLQLMYGDNQVSSQQGYTQGQVPPQYVQQMALQQQTVPYAQAWQQQMQVVPAVPAAAAQSQQQGVTYPTNGIATVQEAMNVALQRSREMAAAPAMQFQQDYPFQQGQHQSRQDEHADAVEAAQANLLACLPPHLQAAVAPPPQLPGVDPICGPLYAKPIAPNVLAVTVHKADAFRCDTMVTNPVVRMHVLDPNTGEYMRSLITPGIQLDPTTQELMLRYPGRPAAVTVGNNNNSIPQPALQEYLPPAQTAPFNLLRRGEPGAVAVWGETLLVDEALERLVALDALIVFEVLQLPVSFHRYAKHPDEFRAGVHRVAWAFLRLAGNAQPGITPNAASPHGAEAAALAGMMLGVQSPRSADGACVSTHTQLLGDLKLQLYRYRPEPMLPGSKAAVQAAEGKLAAAPTRAFTAWKALMSSYARGPPSSLPSLGLVDKYPAALHITLAAAPRPDPEVVCIDPAIKLRAVLPAGYGSGFEEGSVPLLQFMAQKFGTSGVGTAAAITGVISGTSLEKSPYYRSKGEACMLPNKPWKQLPTGPGGATAIAFSWDGGRVAVAVGDGQRAETFHILVYSTVSCAELARMHCAHQGWVHALSWSKDDTALLSVSADGTARVWEMALFDNTSRSIRPRVLRHAAPVYAAAFHPLTQSHPIIVTAGKSGSLHMWHRFSGQQLASIPHDASVTTAAAAWAIAAVVMAQEPAGQRAPRRTGSLKGGRGELLGAIHALAFDNLGTRLWAADQHGTIQEFGVDGAAITAAIQRLTGLAAVSSRMSHNGPPQTTPSCVYPQDNHPAVMQQIVQPPVGWPAIADGCQPGALGSVTSLGLTPGGTYEGQQPCWQAGSDCSRPAAMPPALLDGWAPDEQQRHWAAAQQHPYDNPPENGPDPQCVTLMGPPVCVYAHLGGPVSYQQLPAASPTPCPPPPPPPSSPPYGDWQQQACCPPPEGLPLGMEVGAMQPTHVLSWAPQQSPGPGPICEGVEMQQQSGPNWGAGQPAVYQVLPDMAHQQGVQPVQQGIHQQNMQYMQPVQQGTTGYMQYTVHPDPVQDVTWAPEQQPAYMSMPSSACAPLQQPPYVVHDNGSCQCQQQPQMLPDGSCLQPWQQQQQQQVPAWFNPAQASPAHDMTYAQQQHAMQAAAAAPLTAPLPGQMLRSMRSCQALSGQPIASLTLHPAGRKLIILTHSNRMVTLDTRAFREPRDLGRVKCKSSGLVKAAISPDGAYVITGGEDGVVCAWDADCVDDDVPSVTLPHLGCGRPVACVAWNPQMQMVAVSSWGSWSPLLLAVYDASLPAVDTLTSDGLVRTELYTHKSEASKKQYSLPDKLTPALVHALLADVRSGARQRGILPSPPMDPALACYSPPGQHLRLDGSPNMRGAYGQPQPHAIADQLVVCKPRPEDMRRQQQAELDAATAAQFAEDAARLAGRLTFNTPSNAVSVGSTPARPVQQTPIHNSDQPSSNGSPNKQQSPCASQGQLADAVGSQVPLSQAVYSPGGFNPADDCQTPRAAAFTASGPLYPQPGPDMSSSPGLDMRMYTPNLRGAVQDGPAGVRESMIMRDAAGLPQQQHPAVDRAPIRPRPRPLHELPELANKSFAAANPPQQHLQPIMAGPGATVIVGPGATVVAHEGATVMPAVDPLAGYVPNVSQRPYEMRLSTALSELPPPAVPGASYTVQSATMRDTVPAVGLLSDQQQAQLKQLAAPQMQQQQQWQHPSQQATQPYASVQPQQQQQQQQQGMVAAPIASSAGIQAMSNAADTPQTGRPGSPAAKSLVGGLGQKPGSPVASPVKPAAQLTAEPGTAQVTGLTTSGSISHQSGSSNIGSPQRQQAAIGTAAGGQDATRTPASSTHMTSTGGTGSLKEAPYVNSQQTEAWRSMPTTEGTLAATSNLPAYQFANTQATPPPPPQQQQPQQQQQQQQQQVPSSNAAAGSYPSASAANTMQNSITLGGRNAGSGNSGPQQYTSHVPASSSPAAQASLNAVNTKQHSSAATLPSAGDSARTGVAGAADSPRTDGAIKALLMTSNTAGLVADKVGAAAQSRQQISAAAPRLSSPMPTSAAPVLMAVGASKQPGQAGQANGATLNKPSIQKDSDDDDF